jgi:Domain of unknown function (DUF4271)
LHKINTTNPLKHLFWLFTFAVFTFPSFAKSVGPNDAYSVVHDYKDEWFVYDDGYETYIPYIAERHFKTPAHVIFCELERNRKYDLLIKCEGKNNFLFIDGSLKQEIIEGEWLVIPFEKLYATYKKKQIYLTIYGSTDISSKKVAVGYKMLRRGNNIAKNTSEEKDNFQIMPRKRSSYRSPIAFLSLIVFGVFAFLSSSYTRSFDGYYNLRGLFTLLSREQSLFANKAMSRTSIFFIILLSLIGALLYLLLQSQQMNLTFGRWLLQEGDTVGVLFSNYFKLSLLFFLGAVFKYFFLLLMGRLFNIDKVVELHYFKLLQATLLFFSLLMLFVLGYTLGYQRLGTEGKNVIYYLLIFFYTIRTIVVFLAINRTMPIQILYLISYLCIVEVIPAIIGLRLLM